MILYLITGFLGAGKTSLLNNLAQSFPDKKRFIIVNEFGKQGVDGTLLEGTGAELVEINNGSIFCACRISQFEEALHLAIQHQPDLLFVEASGLADPTNFHSLLAQPAFSSIQWKGTLCLVDGLNFPKVVYAATQVVRQLQVSTVALINKTDLISPQQLEQVRQLIEEIHPQLPQYATQFGKIQPDWLDQPLPSDLPPGPGLQTKDITLQKAVLILQTPEPDSLRLLLESVAPNTFRVKGFVLLSEEVWQVSCTGSTISITKWQGSPPKACNQLVVLAGKGMALQKSLKQAQADFPQLVAAIQ